MSRTIVRITTALILFSVLASGLMAQSPVRHQRGFLRRGATSSELDARLTEGMTDPILFVSVENGIWLPRPVGIDQRSGAWQIANLDGGVTAQNTVVWVMAVDGARMNSAFRHVTTRDNLVSSWTVIDHPAANNDPDAILIVTPVAGQRSESTVGVWYSEGRWTIYNQDNTAILEGRQFNVFVVNGSSGSELDGLFYAERLAVQSGRYGLQAHEADLPIRERESVSLFATHDYGSSGPYLTAPISVAHDGVSWIVQNTRMLTLEQGTLINVVAVRRGDTLPPYGIVSDGALISVTTRSARSGFTYSSEILTEFRSVRSAQSVILTFQNQRDEPATIYWVDYEGKRVNYGRLDPGASRKQPSFATHVWELVGDSGVRFLFIATNEETQTMSYQHIER